MIKFIHVPLHRAGRTITQRYPARSVGEKQPGALGAVDFTCLECGFVECECPGGGWPPPIASELPADAPPAEPYGCVNRTAESPRECAESAHYWCQKSKPAEPTLRAGWLEIAKIGMHRRFMYSDFTAMLFTDGSASLVDYLYRTVGAYHTLEAAMRRAEELAGESEVA